MGTFFDRFDNALLSVSDNYALSLPTFDNEQRIEMLLLFAIKNKRIIDVMALSLHNGKMVKRKKDEIFNADDYEKIIGTLCLDSDVAEFDTLTQKYFQLYECYYQGTASTENCIELAQTFVKLVPMGGERIMYLKAAPVFFGKLAKVSNIDFEG